ncbi:MAG: alpha/beta fold hydrolase [Candidatus Aenigmarchaeota archaeon]|nr:alpha/beta fold hydrolase [Candidatus Aenigmarchaeota archaeon]
MKEIPVTFKSHGKQIVGMLHLPNRKNAPVIIMCHGYFGSKEGAFYIFVDAAREFCRNGYAVFRFDYRGSGDSEGKFENQRIKTMSEDVDSSLKFLKTVKNIDLSKIGIVGHSKGGTIAILSARRYSNIKAVVAWATVSDYKKLWWDEEWLKESLERGYTTKLMFGYKEPARIFLDTFKYNILKEVGKLKNILFIHGNNDLAVPFSHSRWLYNASRKPKKLVKIENADHLFVPQMHRKKVIKETLEWFKKWLK